MDLLLVLPELLSVLGQAHLLGDSLVAQLGHAIPVNADAQFDIHLTTRTTQLVERFVQVNTHSSKSLIHLLKALGCRLGRGVNMNQAVGQDPQTGR